MDIRNLSQMLPELFVSKSLQKQPSSEAIQFWSAGVWVHFPANITALSAQLVKLSPLRWKYGGIFEVASDISVLCPGSVCLLIYFHPRSPFGFRW